MRTPLLLLYVFLPACATAAPFIDGEGTPWKSAAASGAASATPSSTPVAILLDGLGTHHHAVTTQSPEAQKFFDQGLRLLYGFNHDEAIRAFREAVRLDPGCAMAHWGHALALGPNINLPSDPQREAAAFEEAQSAQRHAGGVSPLEREYIAALQARVAKPVNGIATDHSALDRAYAEAMRTLARNHPEDLDAQVLWAESMMDLRPWQLWGADGKPAPGTDEIVSTLENVLAKDPDHPGANHYYVHAMEASPHPEKALEAAARLPKLMPGAGHIVHMPSHVYIHTSMWKEASDANVKAIEVDKAYLERAKPEGLYAMMYVAHNFQFLWATASMEGRSKVAITAATDMAAKFPDAMLLEMEKEMPGIDYAVAPPLIARVRFGKWDELLAVPAPASEMRYLAAMRHFARVFAFAKKHDLAAAKKEAATLHAFSDHLSDKEMLGPLNSARATFAVAVPMADGVIAEASGKPDQAIAKYREAVVAEDALNYDEPPPWPLPARHYLGGALLDAKKPAEAAAVYEADLKKNPENGWALFGLAKALHATKDPKAKDVDARFEKAWSRSDVTLSSSRF